MSTGSPIITIRLSQATLDRIDEELASRNAHSPGAEWDRSAWLRHAIFSKIRHADRGRAPRRRKAKEVEPYAG